MVAMDVEKQLEILSNPLKIKRVIFKNGGIYDDCHNWISLASGKISGVIKLKNGICAVLFKADCQSINIVSFDDDNINLQVTDYSIGQNYFGILNKENVDRYNDSVLYNDDRIEKFTIIRKNSIDIKDLTPEMIENIGKIYTLPIVGKEEEIELCGLIRELIYSDPFETVSETMLHNDIQKVLSTLTDREETILKLRFGFVDGNSRSLMEISRDFNLTPTRIRQIEAKALRKLRQPGRHRILISYLR